MNISIILLTRNAGDELEKTLSSVFNQSITDFEIILVDSGSTDRTIEIAESFPVKIHKINPNDFDHGGTRNLGAKLAKGGYLVYLTQDAIPANRRWLENLIKPLANKKVAGVFSRQIPKKDANPMERFFLSHHFTTNKLVRPFKNKKSLVLYDIFFSNVSSAIKKDVWKKHKYQQGLIMSEDQQWAKEVIAAGYQTVYEPSSVVFHSHKYTLKTAFQRYFDSAYSLHKITGESFRTFAGEGLKYTKKEARFIWKEYKHWLPYLFFYDVSKFLGFFFGKYADCLPLFLKKRFSLHKGHWA
jgi:rhamnosyltransferase